MPAEAWPDSLGRPATVLHRGLFALDFGRPAARVCPQNTGKSGSLRDL